MPGGGLRVLIAHKSLSMCPCTDLYRTMMTTARSGTFPAPICAATDGSLYPEDAGNRPMPNPNPGRNSRSPDLLQPCLMPSCRTGAAASRWTARRFPLASATGTTPTALASAPLCRATTATTTAWLARHEPRIWTRSRRCDPMRVIQGPGWSSFPFCARCRVAGRNQLGCNCGNIPPFVQRHPGHGLGSAQTTVLRSTLPGQKQL